MKIVLAEEWPQAAREPLQSLASELIYAPDATARSLRDLVRGASVLIYGDVRVSAETIARAESLQLLVHAGPGTGDVALEEASAQGIFVTHCPDQHAAAVAELALGLILALDRRIVESTLALREGRWSRSELLDARGLAGRTLGILGFGPAGRELARRARAFQMRVLAWAPSPKPGGEAPAEAEVEFCNWPREVARGSDWVVVLLEGTEVDVGVGARAPQGVDADFLANMAAGAALIHLGNAGTVDEAALVRAVEAQRVRVAIDAFRSEPTGDVGHFRCRLCELPGFVGTQHFAESTAQAREAIAAEVLRIVQAFAVSGEVLNCLNLVERSPATWQLVMRLRDQVGVMASILEAIRADGINAEEINCRVFTGAKAAWCTIGLDERPSTEALTAMRAMKDVLHLELRAVV